MEHRPATSPRPSRRSRWARYGGLALAALAAASTAGVTWGLVRRARRLRAALEKTEDLAPFLAQGWTEVASNVLTGSPVLDVDVPGRSCFVAVSTAPESFHVRSAGVDFEALGSGGWCGCEPSRASIAASGAAPGSIGLRLLRVDGEAFGGPLARAWSAVAPADWGGGGEACADAFLDAWIDAGGGRDEPPAAAPGAVDPWAGSLARAGFRAVASVRAERPFAVVQMGPSECALAVSVDPQEPISLRAKGGRWLISRAPGALGWCAAKAATTTVWRDGVGPAFVLAVPAERVGGLLGVREWAGAAGVTLAEGATWRPDEDLAWDASELLRASLGARDASDVHAAVLPPVPEARDSRLVALALSPAARIAADPPSQPVFCDPPRRAWDEFQGAVCAQAGPIGWWRRSDGVAAGARAPLPFWMSPLEGISAPDAVAHVPELLSLARRLGAIGFEPTLFDGVSELPAGVRITGRAGEDAIVAIGLGPKAPWVFPFSEGAPWHLGGAPRIISLAPGDAVRLTSSPPPNAPLEKRRTVVFRHAARVQ